MTPKQMLNALRPALPRPQLNARQLAIMMFLAMRGAVTDSGEVGRELLLHKPAVCRAADALGILGYVKRQRNAKDTRRVYFYLTDEGRAFIASMGIV